MRAENNRQKTQPKQAKKKTRLLKWLLAAAVVFIVLVVLLLPAFVSSEKGRKIILARINNAIDGQTDFATLSMSWFKGVEVADFSFNDSAGQILVEVRQIATKPHYISILMGGLSFGKTIIDEPKVEINLKRPQPEKTEDARRQTSTPGSPHAIILPVKKIDLVVNDGNLKVTDRKTHTVELSQINSRLNLQPPPQQTNFDLNMTVVDNGKESKIHADGRIRPALTKTGWSLKGTSGDFTVNVDDLDLQSLTPLFAIIGKEIQADGKLNADVNVKIDDGRLEKLYAKVVLSDLKKSVDGKVAVLDEPITIDAQISSDDKTVNIDKLNIHSSFCRLSSTGGVNAVSCNLSADLKGLQEFAGQFIDFGDYGMAGNITADGKLSFGKDRIKADGRSHVENFIITGPDKKPTPVISVDMPFDVEVDTADNILHIASINPTSRTLNGPGDIDLKNSVVPLGPESDKKLALTVSANLDLNKLQPFLSFFASLPEGLQIAGMLKSNLSLTAKKDGYRIATDATKIENLKLSYPQQKPFEQKQVSLVFDAELNPVKKSVDIRKLQLVSPQIKIKKGRFSQATKAGKTRLEGQLDCEYDWSALTTVAAPYLPQGLKLQGQREDTIDFSCEYPAGQTEKLLEHLNTKARLGFEKAQYMGLNFGPTEVDIQIRNGLLKIAPFSTTVNNGQFNFAAEADFKQKPVLLKTAAPAQMLKDIEINDETTGTLLMYLNPVFANAVNVSGVANFNCERLAIPLAKADKKDIVAVGTISIERLRLQPSDLLGQILSLVDTQTRGQDITIHPTRFVLRNGFLQYDDMQMDIGDNPVNFKGTIGLDKSLDMTITLPYTLKGTTARVDKETIAQRISLPLKGTTDRPELDLGKLLEEQLKKRLEEELLKGLEGLFK